MWKFDFYCLKLILLKRSSNCVQHMLVQQFPEIGNIVVNAQSLALIISGLQLIRSKIYSFVLILSMYAAFQIAPLYASLKCALNDRWVCMAQFVYCLIDVAIPIDQQPSHSLRSNTGIIRKYLLGSVISTQCFPEAHLRAQKSSRCVWYRAAGISKLRRLKRAELAIFQCIRKLTTHKDPRWMGKWLESHYNGNSTYSIQPQYRIIWAYPSGFDGLDSNISII